MKRPIHMDLVDAAFEEFKKTEWYKVGVRPLQDEIQYPENYIRRIFDDAFYYGRVSKINHPMTSGDVIIEQYKTDYERFKKRNPK